MADLEKLETSELEKGLGAASRPNAMTDEIGTILEPLEVEIDYAIIHHFSTNLYGSPNKAVEELVSNGFDAFAEEVHVYIPGPFVVDSVVVWDDGASMDVPGLHRLWWIARSPKVASDIGRIARHPDGRTRPMIGKFGIGKLASFAVGKRITHVCRRDGRFLQVTFDSTKVPELRDTPSGAADRTEKFTTFIYELTEGEAKQYVVSTFRKTPEALQRMLEKPSWTLAVITDLKQDIQLHERRLSWVIGNGMPLRPDFKVLVNDKPVESKISRGAQASWDFNSDELRKSVESTWESSRKSGNVKGEAIYVGAEGSSRGLPAAIFPQLGRVECAVHFFSTSLRLQSNPGNEEPLSYGFFVMVRDRLLNPEDPKLEISDPSYGTFYRCQYVIFADGLDDDLLADRERRNRNTARSRELDVLRDAMYRASRQKIERDDEQTTLSQSSGVMLPVESRDWFRAPVMALLLREGRDTSTPFDPVEAATIQREALGSAERIALIDASGAGFRVNTNHPLLSAIVERIGKSAGSREALRAFDLLAVSEKLFEGFLFEHGVDDHLIQAIVAWREGSLRAIATRYSTAPIEDIDSDTLSASYLGRNAFEKALASLFRDMGFEAEVDGASGKKDVLVIAPIGRNHFRFTIEAKGSQHGIANDAAEISGAAAHRSAAEASHALVVAREFSGFKGTVDRPAILKECDEYQNVSIVTVETLIQLRRAVKTYYYPLETILPILATIESPADKLARVTELQRPTEQFDYRGVLKKLWELQMGQALGDIVAYRNLWQLGPARWGLTSEQFLIRLNALQTLSDYLLQIDENDQAVTIRQHPDNVIARIQANVAANEELETQASVQSAQR